MTFAERIDMVVRWLDFRDADGNPCPLISLEEARALLGFPAPTAGAAGPPPPPPTTCPHCGSELHTAERCPYAAPNHS